MASLLTSYSCPAKATAREAGAAVRRAAGSRWRRHNHLGLRRAIRLNPQAQTHGLSQNGLSRNGYARMATHTYTYTDRHRDL